MRRAIVLPWRDNARADLSAHKPLRSCCVAAMHNANPGAKGKGETLHGAVPKSWGWATFWQTPHIADGKPRLEEIARSQH
jgi:hypothetical protein